MEDGRGVKLGIASDYVTCVCVSVSVSLGKMGIPTVGMGMGWISNVKVFGRL